MNIARLLDLARRRVDHGLSVIPVFQDKRPALTSWKPYQERLPSDEELRYFFGSNPYVTGMALVCGQVSGGALVIDIDDPAILTPFQEAAGSRLDQLIWQRTGSGGFQFACACDEPGTNQKLAMTRGPDGKIHVRVETRGEGGYAIMPESLHPSGNVYEALRGDWTQLPRVPMDTVLDIIDAAKSLNEVEQLTRPQVGRSADIPSFGGRLSLVKDIILAYRQRVDLVHDLERRGYRIGGRSRDGGVRMIRPGGKSASVSIDPSGMIAYAHSSSDPLNFLGNAKGLPWHDVVSVAVTLDHGGDFKAALPTLAEKVGIAYHVYVPESSSEPAEDPAAEQPDAIVYYEHPDSKTLIITDSHDAATVLVGMGCSAVVGPVGVWPVSWIQRLAAAPYVRRYLWMAPPMTGLHELLALDLDAQLVTSAWAPAVALTDGKWSALDVAAHLKQAVPPVWSGTVRDLLGKR